MVKLTPHLSPSKSHGLAVRPMKVNSCIKNLCSVKIKKRLVKCFFVVSMLMLCMFGTATHAVTPPQDPESISYWRSLAITPLESQDVALAHSIYQRLLQAWDITRIPPALYVVPSENARPSAESLADGTIILSQDAITFSLRSGGQHGEDYLAFVLAHELAHQRSDDLWRKKNRRLEGGLGSVSGKRSVSGSTLLETPEQLENKEIRADQEGVMMMALVGFDPNAVINNEGLFTQWLESIRGRPCVPSINSADNDRLKNDVKAYVDDFSTDIPCAQAHNREERLRVRLQDVANQSVLFELGVQAYVAGQYAQARNYFQVFGRDYPGRAIRINIGLTYLSEALELRRQLNVIDVDRTIPLPLPFYYPLMLDVDVKFRPVPTVTRNAEHHSEAKLKRLKRREEAARLYAAMNTKIQAAIKLFDAARQIDPKYREGYVLLVSAYLLKNNVHLARGLILDEYVPKYGCDAAAEMLLATATAIEGNLGRAKAQFRSILEKPETSERHQTCFATLKKANLSNTEPVKHSSRSNVDDNADNEIIDEANNELSIKVNSQLVLFGLYHNYALILEATGDWPAAKQLWSTLARAQQKRDAVLFQLARAHLRSEYPAPLPLNHQSKLGAFELGKKPLQQEKSTQVNPIWMEGERLQLHRNVNGFHYVLKNNNEVLAAWQLGGEERTQKGINIGDGKDRVLIQYGLPSRVISSPRGQYLAYDAERFAFQVSGGEVKGWFIY